MTSIVDFKKHEFLVVAQSENIFNTATVGHHADGLTLNINAQMLVDTHKKQKVGGIPSGYYLAIRDTLHDITYLVYLDQLGYPSIGSNPLSLETYGLGGYMKTVVLNTKYQWITSEIDSYLSEKTLTLTPNMYEMFVHYESQRFVYTEPIVRQHNRGSRKCVQDFYKALAVKEYAWVKPELARNWKPHLIGLFDDLEKVMHDRAPGQWQWRREYSWLGRWITTEQRDSVWTVLQKCIRDWYWIHPLRPADERNVTKPIDLRMGEHGFCVKIDK